MKSLKIIGLTALATMTLAAFVTSSASAATVCSTAGKGTACKAGHGNQYTGEVHAVNTGNVYFTATDASGATVNSVTYLSSTFSGAITDSESGAGSITAVSFSGLSSSRCSYVALSTSSPWPFTVTTESVTENTNGIMSIPNMAVSFTCSYLGVDVICRYKTGIAQAAIDGIDTEPTVTLKNVLLEKEEGPEYVCGSKLDWTVTYKITTPSSLFIE
ncbi:MAG TPA: hypothetical protein VEP91_01235 [Solirubrobacterales bacterium]|nr:hypothetical protein [Solirubrobacterales bacterium]